MEIRTKYNLNDYLYFIHKRRVRHAIPEVIEISEVPNVDSDGDLGTVIIINYLFVVEKGKSLVMKGQNEVFKRRADLIKSL